MAQQRPIRPQSPLRPPVSNFLFPRLRRDALGSSLKGQRRWSSRATHPPGLPSTTSPLRTLLQFYLFHCYLNGRPI